MAALVACAVAVAVASLVPAGASAFNNGDVCNYTQATPPTAAFSFSPQSPSTGDSVEFNGSSSTAGTAHVWTWVSADNACEESGNIVTDPIGSYAWSFGDGAGGTGATTSHGYAVSGSYSAKLTVTESLCHTNANHTFTCFTNSVTHSVTVADRRPTASFEITPASVSTGQSASFDASASADPDGTVVSYHWDFGDGQTQTASSPVIAHVYNTAGVKTITLTITDNSGSRGSVQHNLTVADRPPTASFTAPASVNTAQAASFDASASADPDGTITSYHWDFGDGHTQNTSSPTTTHTYGTAGPETVTLLVTDNSGNTDSATHTITITPNAGGGGGGGGVSDRAPTASFTAPASVTVGQAAGFDASASADPDGTVVSYHWDFGDGHTQDTSTPVLAHVYSTAGIKTVTLTVTDNNGNSGQAQHSLTVTPPMGGKCVVPSLRGKKLATARKLLTTHHCRLGTAHRKHSAHHKGRVIRQSAKPGSQLPTGSKVGITIGT